MITLTQPASVTVQPGQRLTITCQVSYSVSSYATAWIRQPAGKGLEWIGIARVGYRTDYKDSLKNKFSIDLDSSSNTVTLNGQNVQSEDTAVYYCSYKNVFLYLPPLETFSSPSITFLCITVSHENSEFHENNLVLPSKTSQKTSEIKKLRQLLSKMMPENSQKSLRSL
uniref:Ig-like domain-containing protein n=1 Tax=Sparus aurata TaxID=8175 RepID=A0A671UWK2_SPAAU